MCHMAYPNIPWNMCSVCSKNMQSTSSASSHVSQITKGRLLYWVLCHPIRFTISNDTAGKESSRIMKYNIRYMIRLTLYMIYHT